MAISPQIQPLFKTFAWILISQRTVNGFDHYRFPDCRVHEIRPALVYFPAFTAERLNKSHRFLVARRQKKMKTLNKNSLKVEGALQIEHVVGQFAGNGCGKRFVAAIITNTAVESNIVP